VKLTVKGGGNTVSLTQKDYLAKGGEGEVYAKGGLVYKVCDPGKMIPADKFAELAVLDHSRIIRPMDILQDASGKDVGYTMRHVPKAVALCQLFTKAFRNRNQVDHPAILNLVRQMQDTINFVHTNNILIVDLNELNFLVESGFADVDFIDVNSYQTPHYPATALMESVRDRHCQGKFSRMTDWFSFGIVSFQMFAGIHPYKGMHPSFADPKVAMDERMKANISVFNPQVSYPKGACQDFAVIPQAYKDWYRAIFDDGKRVPPPGTVVPVILVAKRTQVISAGNLEITLLHDFGEDIVDRLSLAGIEVVRTINKVFLARKEFRNLKVDDLLFAHHTSIFAARLEGRRVKVSDVHSGEDVVCGVHADRGFEHDGRVYLVSDDQVMELGVHSSYGRDIASIDIIGSCLPNGTRVLDGALIQEIFGAVFVSLFPEPGVCHQVRLREITGKVVDGKFDNKTLLLIEIDSSGKYHRHVFRFDDDYSVYRLRTTVDVPLADINMVVLDNGTGILVDEQDRLEVFRDSARVVEDPSIARMRLCKQGNQVLFHENSKLYSARMK
jgi:serine/threonine protein kinase